MSAPVVVVVGSLHYDIMVDAPDRPRKGETVVGTAWRPKFGGKGGNQAVAAAAQGMLVRMAGSVGDDAFGVTLLRRLDEVHVDRAHVRTLAGQRSGMSVAISDAEGDYGAVIVSGSNLAIAPDDLADPALWQDAQALILQNEVPDAVNLAAATAARSAGAWVCLNAAPARALPDNLEPLLDLLVVNALEAEALSGIAVHDRGSAARAAAVLRRTVPRIVVTVGSDGLAALDEGDPILLPARAVTLVSTHGAGDVFVGAFVAALVDRQPFSTALASANDAAAAHVSRPA